MEISELLSNIIKERLRNKIPDVDKLEIMPNTLLLNDLALDSLEVMETIMAAENALKVKIPDNKIYNIYKFEDLCNLFKNATEK